MVLMITNILIKIPLQNNNLLIMLILLTDYTQDNKVTYK